MHRLWIIAVIACGVLAMAGAASASVREEVRSLASELATVATPSESPSPFSVPSTESSTLPTTPGEATAPLNRGGAVSAVARDKEAMGAKTLPNGKTVTNHGIAVSAAAHDKGDAATKPGAAGRGKGKSGD